MTTTDPRPGPYPTGNTPGVRRHRIAVTPTMSTDTAAEVIVYAANDASDERTLRVQSTALNGGKRFVELGLTLAARRELIEALGGVIGPDWGDD